MASRSPDTDEPCNELRFKSLVPSGRLLHGTVSTYGRGIVAAGNLEPRGKTNIEVTERTGQSYLDSNKAMVYLSTVSALTYASSLAEQSRADGDKSACPCVVAVDISALSFRNLYPDEDYVAMRLLQQELNLKPHEGPHEKHERRLAEIQQQVIADAESHRALLCESLDVLGAVGHKGSIPLSAVASIVVMENASGIRALSNAVNSMSKNRQGFGLNQLERQLGPPLIRWFMGEMVAPEEFPEAFRGPPLTNMLAIKPEIIHSSL